jgi:protein-disulfide isomerase
VDSSGKVGAVRGLALRLRALLDLMATVAVIGAAVAILWQGSGPPRAGSPTGPSSRPFPIGKSLSLESVPILGSRDAAVVIVEFADFQCPYCVRFARQVLPRIREKYIDRGRLALAFRHLPSERHPYARQAGVVAECARREGRFWPLYDSLFALDQMTSASLDQAASAIGVTRSSLEHCRSDGAVERVDADVAVARSLQIGSTPTFLIGARARDGTVTVQDVVVGARDIEHFARVIDAYASAQQ